MKTDKDKYEPNEEQLIFAETYVKNCGQLVKTCKEMGIGDGKYYRWCKQDGFQRWLSLYCKEAVIKRFGKWYLIAEKFAERGSFQHLNMLMQIVREFAPEPLVDQSYHLTIIRPGENEQKRVEALTEARRSGFLESK